MNAPGRPCALVNFRKTGLVRFVGHLDMARAFDRAVRRSGLPVAYTEGYNPRARIAFGPPLPLGAESVAEVCAMDLAEATEPEAIRRALAPQLPPGLEITGVCVQRRGRRSPVAGISRVTYEAALAGATEESLASAVAAMMSESEVLVCRAGADGDAVVNIRPSIIELGLTGSNPLRLRMTLSLGEGPSAKPVEVVQALGERGAADLRMVRLVRTACE